MIAPPRQTETARQINKTTGALNRRIGAISGVFDPRIIVADDGSRSVWNSESIELAKSGIKDGFKLKESPFLKTVKDAQLKKGNLPFKYTDDEMAVLAMCMDDKIMFGNNFVSLKDADMGWQRITLRYYQEELLQKYADHNWNILMFPRQSGKTTTTVIEIVHFCCFNFDKDCVVIAQSEMVVNEILKKVKEAFASLPSFMQPGFISFNAKGFALDNGCRLSIGIASESVVQGFSLDFLFIDEFGYIPNSKVTKFWNNIYPALVNNPNSRCIIASTPNGRNKFYELWIGGIMKTNRFINSRIYWTEVPRRPLPNETPDEALERFKQDTIANVGIEAWEMGFECSFDTQLKSIFSTKIQKQLRLVQKLNQSLWSEENHKIGEMFNISFISQSKIVEMEDGTKVDLGVKYDLKNDYFLIGVDLSEGLGQDNSIFKIRKMDWDMDKKKIKYTTIGMFKSNDISVEDFAQMNLDVLKYFDYNKTRIVVETNNYGGEYFNQIDNLYKFDPNYGYFDNVVFAKFIRNSKDDFERGVRWDKSNKKVAVKSFSNLVTTETFIESNYLSIEEYLNFGKNANDTYAAQYGNDDTVMVDVSMSHFIKSNNMYAKEFILNAESDMRRMCKDLSFELLATEEKIKKEQENIWKDENGFHARNSENMYNNRKSQRNRNKHYLI